MPHIRARIAAACMVAAGAFLPFPSIVNAASPTGFIQVSADDVTVEQPWARASAGNASTAAAYVTLVGGTQPDRLVGVTTDAATTAEVHESITDNGVMKMRPVTGGLEIKPGQTVELKPQSFHIMMMGGKQPIEQGKPFKASLTFEKAGSVDVEFAVQPVGSPGPAAAHDHMHMN